jgi:hypothetical protein
MFQVSHHGTRNTPGRPPGGSWLEQVNACTADRLHHVTVRTAGYSDETESDDDAFAAPDRRVLRVIYGGPQRFETYDELDAAPPGGRVDQVLVVV